MKQDTRFLIVGLGSMGKRRVRCLRALGYEDIHGVDFREDRRLETQQKYGIPVHASIDAALAQGRPAAVIISVPPHIHHDVMKRALKENLPFFVEASVTDTDMETIKTEAKAKKILAAPSYTMFFHPGVQIIKRLVTSGALGVISNVIHQSGQYLPDWHTYEKVSDYYVSRKDTGGAREIVPFELAWIVPVFGFPARVCGCYRKTIEIEGAPEIDDTYNCLFDYQKFLMILTVDVVSRHATRRLTINGSLKQLVWDWDEKCVKVFDPGANSWEQIPYSSGPAAAGYNANIGETMYIEELRTFIDALHGKGEFANTLENDHNILKLLYAVEKANDTGRYVEIER